MPSHISPTKPSSAPSSASGLPARFNTEVFRKVWNGQSSFGEGSKGPSIKRLQEALEELGFKVGGADGAFGAKTATGLKAIQKEAGLPQSGRLDKDTLRVLVKRLEKKPAAKPESAPAGSAGLSNSRFSGNAQLREVLAGKRTIQTGTKSEAAKAVQASLLDMGFYLDGGADGAFGAQSAKALRNFQTHASSKYPEVTVTGKLDAATLRALDALAPKKGELGQTLNIPKPLYDGKPVRIVVVKNEHRTYLFDKNGKLTDIFANAIGSKGNETETGLKVVRTKLDEAASKQAGKELWGSEQTFGKRILDLSWADGSSSGEELHGTYEYATLGSNPSHGCMRHANESILKMFDAVSVGDRVAVVESATDRRLG